MTTLIYMPVYNEGKNIRQTIESVLQQDYSDFILLISNNHSTDKTSEIIEEFRYDHRIVITSPPEFCTSLRHGEWLNQFIAKQFTSIEYSIFIGGHDIWVCNYLSTLIRGMAEHQNAAIVYSDSYEIDSSGDIIRKHQGYLVSIEVAKPLRPLLILTGLTHNLITGGLWRESIRSKICIRHKCMGIDHFLVAEASLLGDIVYKYGTHIKLRAAEGANDWAVYISKHLGISTPTIEDGIRDFVNQLEWAVHLQEKSILDSAYYSQAQIANSLVSAMVNCYINRYWAHLQAFGSIHEFLNIDEVKNSFMASDICANFYRTLISRQCLATQPASNTHPA